MNKPQLRTPATLVDLDILERNVARYQALCDTHHKALWPMVKTHKSTELALMQQKAGASGFLCGTLDEAEALQAAGIKNLMYAYPVAGAAGIARVIALAKACDFMLRLDCFDSVPALNGAAEAADVDINYTVIVDTGLHRFGMSQEHLVPFVMQMSKMKRLKFKGISTHPGHVYGGGPNDVAACTADETHILAEAARDLAEAGFPCAVVSSGSTPTFAGSVGDPTITTHHPGNYIFHDAIQIGLGVAEVSDCALTVLATIISRPAMDRLVIDAGAKCLGLDQGAHGQGTVKGYGHIKGYPDLELYSLSEEVGKIRIKPGCPLRVGDTIEIIPNHACSAANLTSHLIGCRGDEVERLVAVDVRSNSKR